MQLNYWPYVIAASYKVVGSNPDTAKYFSNVYLGVANANGANVGLKLRLPTCAFLDKNAKLPSPAVKHILTQTSKNFVNLEW
mgnify:CR=1 FL=1